jgi:hypothetical protein
MINWATHDENYDTKPVLSPVRCHLTGIFRESWGAGLLLIFGKRGPSGTASCRVALCGKLDRHDARRRPVEILGMIGYLA